MYNSDIPTAAELPSSAQLLRSTILAAATAAVLLVTTVLPAEYSIDPTGIGRALGLAQMGEIKGSLAKEAEADKQQRSDVLGAAWSRLAGLIIAPAAAAAPAPVPAGEQVAEAKSDETLITLRPGEGTEVKLEMRKGARAQFSWQAVGGLVNFDTHGEPHNPGPNSTHSYKKGRQVTSDAGELQAAFDGMHGWFWRNRGDADVAITLRTSGEYAAIKKMK